MISIGKMSLAAKTSIKTLRYYDRIGLLKPAYVDMKSGYRYYNASQLDDMVQIERYKRLGFSLKEIQFLMQADNAQKTPLYEKQLQALWEQKMILEQSIKEMQQLLSSQSNRERTTTMQNYMIDQVEAQEQPVFSKRQTMSMNDFGMIFGSIFEEMSADHLIPCGNGGARYYDREFNHDATDVEVFVPVCDPTHATGVLESCLCAHTVHTGPYSTLSEAYAALLKWMDEQGYEIAGAPYEIYRVNGFDKVPVDQWKTDIYFPIEKDSK